MQFGLAFGYFINKIGGATNLLYATLCSLIPVVGPIITGGYRAEVATSLIRDPDLTDHPNFDFNRLSIYLMRGLWPFLIGLLVSLAIVIPIVIGVMAGLAIGVATGEPVFGMLIAVACVLVGSISLSMVSIPMVFHAELINRFDLGASWQFARRFWMIAGGPAIATGLLFIPIAFLVSLLGLLCCFIGIYPASIIIQMAAQHLMVQVYAVYLERGGEPIEMYDPEQATDPPEQRRRNDERY